jgi:hypothetical protein
MDKIIIEYYHIQSNMNYSTVYLLDLSDEILLIILNKLNYIDVLYSLIGVD